MGKQICYLLQKNIRNTMYYYHFHVTYKLRIHQHIIIIYYYLYYYYPDTGIYDLYFYI